MHPRANAGESDPPGVPFTRDYDAPAQNRRNFFIFSGISRVNTVLKIISFQSPRFRPLPVVDNLIAAELDLSRTRNRVTRMRRKRKGKERRGRKRKILDNARRGDVFDYVYTTLNKVALAPGIAITARRGGRIRPKAMKVPWNIMAAADKLGSRVGSAVSRACINPRSLLT